MKETDTKKVGEILRKARERLNLTQEEIANKLNIGRDAILRIEKGVRKISAEELTKLASIYNMGLDEILGTNKDNIPTSHKVKGIILAGGSGTRLYPITEGISKQLVPVYDKPMIFYPLSVLMQAGIKDILIITTAEDQVNFKKLLKDGTQFGINISYIVQPSPDGLAQAFILGKKFIGDDSCAMILGDNIFFGNGLEEELKQATINAAKGLATIFGYQVKDPERFGIMELDNNYNVLSVEEKPKHPKSDYAITGLYFYPAKVSEMAEEVKPSKRGELEITTLNDMYLQQQNLKARILGEGYTWFDTGTFDSLLDASNMIRSIEHNKDRLICSPEIIALANKWIDEEQFNKRAELLSKNAYGQSLKKVLKRN